MMDIEKIRNQELAAEQLRAISPILPLARKAFVALSVISESGCAENIESVAIRSSLLLAKSILVLEHDLQNVIDGK